MKYKMLNLYLFPNEIVEKILFNVKSTNLKFVSKEFIKIYTKFYTKQIIKLQVWWRYHRIPDETKLSFLECYTLKTMIRWHIAKVPENVLAKIPYYLIREKGLLIYATDYHYLCRIPKYNIASFFRNFAKKYLKTKDKIMLIG